jgi:hypothetical protein
MTESEEYRPYCGAELLPHAECDDGTPAPIVCDIPVHGRETMHHSSINGTSWQWQDLDGTWMHV